MSYCATRNWYALLLDSKLGTQLGEAKLFLMVQAVCSACVSYCATRNWYAQICIHRFKTVKLRTQLGEAKLFLMV